MPLYLGVDDDVRCFYLIQSRRPEVYGIFLKIFREYCFDLINDTVLMHRVSALFWLDPEIFNAFQVLHTRLSSGHDNFWKAPYILLPKAPLAQVAKPNTRSSFVAAELGVHNARLSLALRFVQQMETLYASRYIAFCRLLPSGGKCASDWMGEAMKGMQSLFCDNEALQGAFRLICSWKPNAEAVC